MLKERLDVLYRIYNNRDYIQYDPLRYVYQFEDDMEKELVGLIASSLAFGRVTQIFKAVETLLEIMENRPLKYIMELGPMPPAPLLSFKYRFVSGMDIYRFFSTTKKLIEEHGSIGLFMKRGYAKNGFLGLVESTIGVYSDVRFLIPYSLKKSACKRLFMYFRWMVRKDNIDLGLWDFIHPGELIIPLDTHIFQIATRHGFTSKRSPSFTVAKEVTEKLKEFCQEDPVKYDWALSHEGIIENNFVARG